MSLKRPKGHPGTLVVLEHHSRILRGNPLGDPHVRKLGAFAKAANGARPAPAQAALRPGAARARSRANSV